MADITRGVRAFTIGTAISRVFGLIRESVFAFLYGAGRSTDAFVAAFRIPNLLRDLFAETALSARRAVIDRPSALPLNVASSNTMLVQTILMRFISSSFIILILSEYGRNLGDC